MPPSCSSTMSRRLSKIEYKKEKTVNYQGDEIELDIIELLNFLKKKLIIILAITLLCASIGFLATKFFMEPEYTASTRMYVQNRTSDTDVLYSDFQSSSQILNDYTVLMTGRNVTEEVVSRLNLPMSYGQVARMIQISTPSGTRVLQINITDTDPQRAADIANAVREVAADQIQSIMDVNAVKTVYPATAPGGPSGPDVFGNTTKAAFVGLVISVVIFVIIFLLDDTIRTEEDVEHYLGLSVLGVIPATEDMGIVDARHHSKKKKSKKTTINNHKK